jgi:hypothetical protein
VEQRAYGDDFCIVGYALKLSEPDREEPGSDSMVEEKRFGVGPTISIARLTSGESITVMPPKTLVFPLTMIGSAFDFSVAMHPPSKK